MPDIDASGDDAPPAQPMTPLGRAHECRLEVGPPLGALCVSVAHTLVGTRVHVDNALWACARGRTWCTVVGFAPDAELGGHRGVFVLLSDDDRMHYPFTWLSLYGQLTAAQRQKAARAGSPSPHAHKRRRCERA